MKTLKLFFWVIAAMAVMSSCGDSDDENPVITLTSSAAITASAGESVDIEGTVSDNEGVTSLTLTSSDFTLDQDLAPDGSTSIPFDIDLALDASTPVGVYTVTLTAGDDANNNATQDIVITVQ